MTTQLLLAIVTITLALIFYTWGVFSERQAGELKQKHLLLFALGLIFDTTGTTIMSKIAKSAPAAGLTLHQVRGFSHRSNGLSSNLGNLRVLQR